MKKVLGCLRRACDEFTMIEDGDRIAVGLSGGKDSILLLYALFLYRQYRKLRYELVGITVDLGFQGFETAPIRAFLEELGVPYHVVSTDISQVVFEIRRESNPCSLCAKMRKGAFYDAAKSLGCNKAAFAHNLEDLLETLLMSMVYDAYEPRGHHADSPLSLSARARDHRPSTAPGAACGKKPLPGRWHYQAQRCPFPFKPPAHL